MNSEICLSCEAIERYLGEEEERVHALRGVSLEVEPGSIHAVVGPSGCGKSSLLYILGLLDPPDAGRVSIESEPVSHLSDDELAAEAEQVHRLHFSVPFPDGRFHCAGKRHDPDAQDSGNYPMQRCASELPAYWKQSAWATNFADPAVIFPAANNSVWLSPARWPTIRESSWRTSRPAISIPPTPSAPSSCCKISCKKAGKLCSWQPIIR